jgi:hypothetical protein
VSTDGGHKDNVRWRRLLEKRYLWLQYTSLSLITALLLIGPFYFGSLPALLIFCGGWSNFVAFYAILRAFKETTENRVRVVLAVQSFSLILILGFDLNRWLGREWLIAAAFIPVALMMFRIGRHVFRAKPVDTKKLEAAWDAIIPSFFLLVSLLVVINTGSIVITIRRVLIPLVASHIGLPAQFIEARDQVYLNLLFIPLLYLVSDLLTSRYSSVAKRSVPLDIIILVVGVACCSCGLASFLHAAPHSGVASVGVLFESGAVAAVLLLGNWIFTLYIDRIEPTSPGTTT